MTYSNGKSMQNLGSHSLQKDFSTPLKTAVKSVALTAKQNTQNKTTKITNFSGKCIKDSLRWQEPKARRFWFSQYLIGLIF